MKRLFKAAAILCVSALLLITAGCSGNGDTSSTGQTETPTQAPTAAPAAAPTSAPTAAPTVAPTVAPTEDPVKAAYAAYADYLNDNSGWFEAGRDSYLPSMQDRAIAIKDLNNDGVPELIHVRPGDGSVSSKIHLVILTCENGSVKTLYDDFLVSIAGQGPSFSIFLDEDSTLYSVAANGVNGTLTRYDFNSDSAVPVCLGESIGSGSSDPDISYRVNGEASTAEEYRELYQETLAKRDVILMSCTLNDNGNENISMTYDDAIDFLESE